LIGASAFPAATRNQPSQDNQLALGEGGLEREEAIPAPKRTLNFTQNPAGTANEWSEGVD
jgi:hypothetical protein